MQVSIDETIGKRIALVTKSKYKEGLFAITFDDGDHVFVLEDNELQRMADRNDAAIRRLAALQEEVRLLNVEISYAGKIAAEKAARRNEK